MIEVCSDLAEARPAPVSVITCKEVVTCRREMSVRVEINEADNSGMCTTTGTAMWSGKAYVLGFRHKPRAADRKAYDTMYDGMIASFRRLFAMTHVAREKECGLDRFQTATHQSGPAGHA